MRLCRPRLVGVDVARGLALLAVHTFPVLDDDGVPTVAGTLPAGRSAATFALVTAASGWARRSCTGTTTGS